MSTLTPTRPTPIVPAPRPAPRPNPYPRPTRPALAPALAKPCPGCGRVWCTCPRKDWFATLAATKQGGGSTVQPGKGTRPPAGGGVHPPRPGWGGKGR